MAKDSGRNKIEQRILDLESSTRDINASLISQEHRLAVIAINFWRFVKPGKDSRNSKELRNAALSAFVYRLFLPTTAVAGSGFVLTLFGVWLAYMANQLLRTQNDLIENQNFLVESSRRSTLVFELSSILDEIDEELDAREATGEIFDDWSDSRWTSREEALIENTNASSKCECVSLSNRLNGRIVAVSKALLPYKYLEDDGKLSNLTSPEQGQLFVSLVTSGVCIPRGTDFSNALLRDVDVSYARLCKANLTGANLVGINLSSGRLIDSNLQIANLTGAVLRSSFLSGASLQSAKLCNANLVGANLERAGLVSTDFKNADLTNANLSTAHIFNAKFTGAILIDSKFTGSVLSDVDFAGSDLSGADFSSTSLRNIDFSSAKNWTKISSVKGAVILVTVPPSRDMYNWAIENGAVYVDTIEKWLDTLTDPQSRAAFEKQLPLQ